MSYNDDNKIRRRKVSSGNSKTKSSVENINQREKNSNNINNKRYSNPNKREDLKTTSKRTKKRKIKKKKYRAKFVKSILMLLLIGLILISSIASVFVFSAIKDATPVNAQVLQKHYISSEVATSEEIPKYLKDAVVSIEDERFYKHNGVDIVSLVRSFIHNLTSDSTQGGSTIEMQVSKNLLTTNDRTMKRKIKDIYNALQMDKTMTKDEILVTYLNNIYLGKSTYGVKKGARVYFGKDISDLTLAQCAMLAGITNNPAKYMEHSEAKKRQETILYKMKELGYINQEQYDQAIREDVPFKSEIE